MKSENKNLSETEKQWLVTAKTAIKKTAKKTTTTTARLLNKV